MFEYFQWLVTWMVTVAKCFGIAMVIIFALIKAILEEVPWYDNCREPFTVQYPITAREMCHWSQDRQDADLFSIV